MVVIRKPHHSLKSELHESFENLYTKPQPDIVLVNNELFQCDRCGKFFNVDYTKECDHCGWWLIKTYRIGDYQTEWFDDLSIDVFKKEDGLMYLLNPHGELFRAVGGLLIDMQSRHLICTIYDALSDKTKAMFNNVICKDEYKLASFFDKMWDWVQHKPQDDSKNDLS